MSVPSDWTYSSEDMATLGKTVVLPILTSTLFFMALKPIAEGYVNDSKLGATKKEKDALADRVVGFVHALISTSGAMYLLVVGAPQTTICTPMGGGFQYLTLFSAGFFINDIIVSFTWGPSYIAHGVMSLCVFVVPAFSTYAQRYATGFLLFELSTIPFHISSYMQALVKSRGQEPKDGSTHPLVFRWQLIFALVFIGVRMGWGVYFSIQYQMQVIAEPEPECIPKMLQEIIRVMNFLFNILNAYWSVKIVRRGLKGGSSSKKQS